MASNNDVNSANGQYDGADLFGFSGDYSSTGLDGGDSQGEGTYGQYRDGRIPGAAVDNVASTGAPEGHGGPVPPADGGSVSATSVFGHLAGNNAPDISGTSSTSKDSLTEPFTHQNVTDTGAGHGSAGSSHTSPADQSSPWRNADGS